MYQITHFGETCQTTGLFTVKKVKTDSLKQILESTIWFNANFCHGQNFIKELHKKESKNVNDLIDKKGELYAFKAHFDVRGTILDLFIRLPVEWKIS